LYSARKATRAVAPVMIASSARITARFCTLARGRPAPYRFCWSAIA
jgi:hypothetical protein